MQFCKWQQEQTSPLLITQRKGKEHTDQQNLLKRDHYLLHNGSIPTGKKTIGTRVSVEFYNDPEQQSTSWYKGTVIGYNKQG